MPRVVVVLDIDAYAKDPRKVAYKGLIEKGELELGGSCPQCGKDLLDVGEVLYGKPSLADGSDWFNSGKSFFDGGSFTYETHPLEWLFENYQLWNRADSIIVCSRECAELRELRFRQTQAEIEIKNNNSEETSLQPESVVIHSEVPSSQPLEVPSSPPPVLSSLHAESLELPVSPGPFSSPPASPFQQQTPTTFKKGGRAPPPPPPRSPSVSHDTKTNTNPFSPSHANPLSPSAPFPFSPSAAADVLSPAAAAAAPPPPSSPPSVHFASSSSPSFENLFSEQPLSPSKVSVKTDNESKASEGRSEQSVGWCLEELNKVHSTLNEAMRRIGELTVVLETLRRPESSHPPPPLPPLPEEEPIKRPLSPALPVFMAPVVLSEADDVN